MSAYVPQLIVRKDEDGTLIVNQSACTTEDPVEIFLDAIQCNENQRKLHEMAERMGMWPMVVYL